MQHGLGLLQLIVVERGEPAQDIRFHVLSLEPSLFEAIALLRECRRSGTLGPGWTWTRTRSQRESLWIVGCNKGFEGGNGSGLATSRLVPVAR